jgi:hypothetical protein
MSHSSEIKKSVISEGQLYGMATNYVKTYEHCIQNYCILASVRLYWTDWEVSRDQLYKNIDQLFEDNGVDNTTYKQQMTTDKILKSIMQPCIILDCSAEKLNILLHHFTAGQQQLGLPMLITSYSSHEFSLHSFHLPTPKP